MHIPGNVSLFDGISSDDVQKLLSCISFTHRSVKKGEMVIREGDSVESVGIVLSGFVQIARNDYDGTRVIQAGFGSGAVFAESLACSGVVESPVSVVASENSEILFIPYRRLIRFCASACPFHQRLIENMIHLIAEKNLLLSGKIEITAKRTIREKVLAYLSSERKKNGSERFEIPYNRNELADFLCVDRSALSRELSRMSDSGILRFRGNSFSLSVKDLG